MKKEDFSKMEILLYQKTLEFDIIAYISKYLLNRIVINDFPCHEFESQILE